MTDAPSQNANLVAEHLRVWNSKAVKEVIEFRGETTIVVPRDLLRATAARCREDQDLQYNLLTDATCVDRYPTEPRFEMNYHLVSISKKSRLRLRTFISGNEATVDSLFPVWPGANWLEREVFDLFGIHFNEHPDLRRILLPDDWEGYPLRRDYPVEGFRDIPGTSPSSGKLFRKSTAQ